MPHIRHHVMHHQRIAVAIIDGKPYRATKRSRELRKGSQNLNYMDNLTIVADNLANHLRILLKDNPRRFREKLRRSEVVTEATASQQTLRINPPSLWGHSSGELTAPVWYQGIKISALPTHKFLHSPSGFLVFRRRCIALDTLCASANYLF